MDNPVRRPFYNQAFERERNHEIEEVGARLRALFAWAEEESETESEEEPEEAVRT